MLIQNLFAKLRFAVLTAALVIPATAGATVLTGADLVASSNVTFPNGNAVVTGSSVQFTGAPGFQVMMDINLDAFGIGTGSGQQNSGGLAITNTRVTSDSDIWMGLFDGTNFLALTSWDGNRTAEQLASTSTIGGTTFSTGSTGSTLYFPTVQNIGDASTMFYDFDLIARTIDAAINGTTRNTNFTGAFDTSQALHFLIGKGSTGETIQIDSVEIVGTSVPAPAPVMLLVLGLLAMVRHAHRI